MWAGIAKALVEEVEKVFGKYTTRLFRAINLETAYEPECKKDQLKIQFSSEEFEENMDNRKFEERLKEYDVLDSCKKTSQLNDKCWMVKCNNADDALRAKTKLQVFKDIEKVSFEPPPATNPGSNDKRSSHTGRNIHCGFRKCNIAKTIAAVILVILSTVLFILSLRIEAIQVLNLLL